MKLVINATILANNNTGLGVYTYHILNYIIPILEKKNIKIDILVGDRSFLPFNARQYALLVNCSNPIKRILSINKYSKKCDVFWSTTQHGVYNKRIKQIITIHDITPIIYPKGRYRQKIYYKIFLNLILKLSPRIITVSNNTKKDIMEFFNISENRIDVIPPALPKLNNDINKNISKEIMSLNIRKKEYFVIIGIHYYYKNVHFVISSLYESNQFNSYKLVIIGNANNEYGKYLKNIVKKMRLEDKVVFTGFVNDAEKDYILFNAKACIFPSKYEGFGLPILEAMSHSIPLFASNVSSIPEIGEDYAFYFDPENKEDFISCMNSINNDKLLKSKLVKAEQYLMKYDWNKIALKVFDIINGVYNE